MPTGNDKDMIQESVVNLGEVPSPIRDVSLDKRKELERLSDINSVDVDERMKDLTKKILFGGNAELAEAFVRGQARSANNEVSVQFKKIHRDAVTPSYAKPGDAGCDMTAVGMTQTDEYIEYQTGVAVAIPEGYVGLLFPRSSVSKKDLILANCVGVVDSGYRGPLTFRFKVTKEHTRTSLSDGANPIYQVGDRIGQIVVMPFPNVTFEEVEELSETERGTGGYGSTGN